MSSTAKISFRTPTSKRVKASAKKPSIQSKVESISTDTPTNANSIPSWLHLWNDVLSQVLASTYTSPESGVAQEANTHAGLPSGVAISPEKLVLLQTEFMHEYAQLWEAATKGGLEPVNDKRFSAPAWQQSPFHQFMIHHYLLNAKTLLRLTEYVDAEDRIKNRLRFAISQIIDALSPSNFLALNPEAQSKVIETGGESLQLGMVNMLADLRKGRISQTDESVFAVGSNVAITPGAVVFQNQIFQLIQYKPTTATVYEKPLLIVPPNINKYYILDLQPDNSMVRYAVSQGFTVFMVSWRNPTEADAHATWDDVISDGIIKAFEVVSHITKQEKINILGFCVGGTLVSTALAVLAAHKKKPANSLTLLTTLLDFEDSGVMDVFIDTQHIKLREAAIGHQGLMSARELSNTFAFLRPNDLVWHYVVSNYLKGESPRPFDLLYWNSDGTNLPGPFFCWYLRHTYLQNELCIPGKAIVCGVPVDLRLIDVPTYLYGSREDHIVPWKGAYASTKLLKNKLRFVLGASGHIAGVINPASKNRRSYWTNTTLVDDPEVWFNKATEHQGSWWPDWTNWLITLSGKKINAPKKLGNTLYPEIEPAPGLYVKVRAV